MTHFFLLAKKKIILFICIIATFLVLFEVSSIGMHYYEKVDFVTGLVTADVLNVRAGTGTNYSVITQVNKNTYIRVFAKIGSWYVIQTDNDYIGAVSTEYVKPIYPNSSEEKNKNEGTYTSNKEENTELTSDEKETLNLINEQRKTAGLAELQIDSEVQNVARIKAKDMANNNYFAHTSPTYGSPFEMLKNYGIKYKSAGENIAGNSTSNGAVTAWMGSEGHRANILNPNYNYTGLAVVKSSKYGKIFVQIFIGK